MFCNKITGKDHPKKVTSPVENGLRVKMACKGCSIIVGKTSDFPFLSCTCMCVIVVAYPYTNYLHAFATCNNKLTCLFSKSI